MEKEYDEVCEKCNKWGCRGVKCQKDEQKIFNTFGDTMRLIHEAINPTKTWPL